MTKQFSCLECTSMPLVPPPKPAIATYCANGLQRAYTLILPFMSSIIFQYFFRKTCETHTQPTKQEGTDKNKASGGGRSYLVACLSHFERGGHQSGSSWTGPRMISIRVTLLITARYIDSTLTPSSLYPKCGCTVLKAGYKTKTLTPPLPHV